MHQSQHVNNASLQKNKAGRLDWALLGLTVLLNFSALFVTIMGPDGALYASIAKSMVQRGDYVNMVAEGRDWLDKPHFPFWVTALSFKLFGFATWAYKLPAILFLLMGAGYTFLLARKLYNPVVAVWAAVVLLTAEHIIISNNDVRAEPYLTGLIIGSVYHFYRANKEGTFLQLFLGSLLAALAVMTKGPFALIPIVSAVGGNLLLNKKYRELFHGRWLLALLLVGIFIIPELYCLWKQFDCHPEKVVFGKTNVSGIRFFFWDSQFGRFFNTGPIRGKGDPFFFVHTLLWAFLPWSILLYVAITMRIKRGLQRSAIYTEWLCVPGALAILLVFSLSRFQLPHYANIVFPFLSIITAAYVFGPDGKRQRKFIRMAQTIILTIMIAAPLLLHYFYRPGSGSLGIGILFLLFVPTIMLLPRLVHRSRISMVMLRVVLASLFLNLYLNTVFYPDLMKYQSGSEVAFYCNENYPNVPVVQLRKDYSYALEFYLNAPLVTIDSVGAIEGVANRPFLFFGPKAQADSVDSKAVENIDHFPVSRLDGKFVYFKTRGASIKPFQLKLSE